MIDTTGEYVCDVCDRMIEGEPLRGITCEEHHWCDRRDCDNTELDDCGGCLDARIAHEIQIEWERYE